MQQQTELKKQQPPAEASYTEKQFCELMQIHRATAVRWREQGVVGFVRINGRIRYLQRHIDQLVRRNEKKGAGKAPAPTQSNSIN